LKNAYVFTLSNHLHYVLPTRGHLAGFGSLPAPAKLRNPGAVGVYVFAKALGGAIFCRKGCQLSAISRQLSVIRSVCRLKTAD